MTRGYRIKVLFCAMAGAIVVAFLIRPIYGIDLVRSFLNAESTIGFWISDVGLAFSTAYAIAVISSTYDILCWFACGNAIKHRGSKLRESYERLAWLKDSDDNILRTAYRLGEVTYRFFVPQRTEVYFLEKDAETFSRDYHFYLPLVLYGAWPGGIWTGVGYTLEFKLNQPAAFAVLALANAFKMLIFGCFSILVNPWWIVLAVVALPFLKTRIQNILRRLFVRLTILQREPTVPQ